MRVAIRRMRVAILVFKIPIMYKKVLRETSKILGDVRDLDVLMEKTQVYLATLPESEHGKLTPFVTEWSKLRNAARKRMLVHLEGDEYRRMKLDILRLAEHLKYSEEMGSTRISDAVLDLIEKRLCHVLDTGKNKTDPTVNELHALRIAFKKLRYTIEFFVDILDADGYFRCIELLKDIQDCLGEIHDSWTAISFTKNFLEDFSSDLDHQDQRSAIIDYLSWRQSDFMDLKNGFSNLWEQFVDSDFENNLLLNAH